MAKPWSEVEQSPEYQVLSPQQQAEAKQEYWDSVVTKKDAYNTLKPQEQMAARQQFFGGSLGVAPQVMPSVPYTMSKSGTRQYDPIALEMAKRKIAIDMPTTKAKIPARQIELLQDTIDVVRGMNDLKKRMNKNKFKTGVLSPRFYPGVKGDLPMQLKGTPEEASFKADTDKYFQKYRKLTTGVQAGYPELQWLAADYPKTTDRPDIYMMKADSAINSNLENAKNMLSTLENAGYDVSKFKEQISKVSLIEGKYSRVGRNKKGQRVGMLPDGNIEVIDE